ncbi:MAG: M24 family metallopeptidase [Desulfarculaceae bacterium]|jgi:Xaa-Pro aminopeptidase
MNRTIPANSKRESERWRFPSFYRLVPEKYLRARVQRAAEMCREQGLVGVLLTQAVDVYYLSGTMQQGVVFVDDQGEVKVFIRRHVERSAAESPLPITSVKGFTEVAAFLNSRLSPASRLGLTLDVVSAAEYLGWKRRLPQLDLVDVAPAWQDLKGIKDSFELEAMARAGKLAAECYAQLPDLIRPGASEAEIAGIFLAQAMAKGAINLVRTRLAYLDNYTWHLVAGPEANRPSALDASFNGFGLSPAFPVGASLRHIKTHEPIIADMSFSVDGYATDQTRTYCLGQAPEIIHRAHECLEAVDQAIMEDLRPGAVSGELFDIGTQVAADHGFSDYFLGQADQRIRYLAHGAGLELGAAPYLLKGSPEKVKAGQCYALELKIVMDIGPVGLENTVAVNPQGPPTLLTPIPNKLFEIHYRE